MKERFFRIKRSHGLERFAEFVGLLCLLRRCDDFRLLSSDPTIDLAAGAARATINTIVEYVNENYSEEMPLAAVSAHVNMSESRFSHFFRKATDSTFTDFVNRVRIHKACELLMNSETQISSICYAVGFNNLANFNRRFREVKGTTPSEFRQQAMARLGSGVAAHATRAALR